jgi:L-ascorbate metabolism protein UlaG (beta-lactamase superfamily)
VRGLTAVILLLVWCGTQLFAADRIPANGGDIIITPLIHSSVQLEHAGVVVQLDPWSAGDLSAAKPADVVLITDDVGHHLDLKAIQRLRKPGAPVVIPAAAKAKIPDGTVLSNGASAMVGGVRVESIAAYDIKPGEPSHPKGEANGYVVTLGGKRIYFGGVTECVPEVKALRNIDVAFVPMNLPLERMTPQAAAECIKAFKPGIVYPYHYDQDYASRIGRGEKPAGGSTLGFDALRKALAAEPVEIRTGAWY